MSQQVPGENANSQQTPAPPSLTPGQALTLGANHPCRISSGRIWLMRNLTSHIRRIFSLPVFRRHSHIRTGGTQKRLPWRPAVMHTLWQRVLEGMKMRLCWGCFWSYVEWGVGGRVMSTSQTLFLGTHGIGQSQCSPTPLKQTNKQTWRIPPSHSSTTVWTPWRIFREGI